MTVPVLSPDEAAGRVADGDTIMVGGFGLVGSPLTLINGLIHGDARDLTVMSNNIGQPGEGLGLLLQTGRIRKAVGSYFTSNPDVVAAYERGDLEVDLMPQGTFAEAIRAKGAGIGGFYTRTAVGTLLAEGREERIIDGEAHLFYEAIGANVAFVRAAKADGLGNLWYSRTAQNFNPDMATAADLVIAEVDQIAEVGEISPTEIATPHVFVDALVLSEGNEQ